MDEEQKISIIVPIYNDEKYLKRCIESILKQTYTNIELILINDGSEDKSLEICEEYKKNDNRIIIVNKENEGVSVARNIGIEKATGELISFVDADDYLEITFLQELFNIMKKYNFKEVMRIKEYWGYRFPDAWCKECNSKPCKCTNVIFVKEVK